MIKINPLSPSHFSQHNFTTCLFLVSNMNLALCMSTAGCTVRNIHNKVCFCMCELESCQNLWICVKMWRCYTQTTIQSIRLIGYYSQRGFNKVNLAAQREHLWAVPLRKQRVCCFQPLATLWWPRGFHHTLLGSFFKMLFFKFHLAFLVWCRLCMSINLSGPCAVWQNLQPGMFSAFFKATSRWK